jgi:hypothetical protein
LKHLNDNFCEGRESIKKRKKKEMKKEGRYSEKEKVGMYQRIKGEGRSGIRGPDSCK